MKKNIIFTAVILIFFVSCNRSDDDLAARLALLDSGAPESIEKIEPEEIRESKREIAKVDGEIKDIIAGVRKKSSLYRTLGLKYMDYQMFSLAVESFNNALDIEPANARLLYYKGVALGQSALQKDSPTQKASLLLDAEQAYLTAIRIDPRFTSSYYALSILLVYELDRPSEAIPYLETYLAIQKSDYKAQLLLAGLKTDQNDKTGALELLNNIIRNGSSELKSEAEIRKQSILEGGR